VLFTDIVASTAATAALGDRRWREMLDHHDAVCTRLVDVHGGRIVKFIGDGMLAIFDRPSRAVTCALDLRDALADSGLETRGGIHVGEVELRGDDIAGVSVNVAQRIQAAAPTGQVLLSRTARDLIAGTTITTTEHGEHELKGVPGRWQLFIAAR
jgi:class 3 adenylate cyclase